MGRNKQLYFNNLPLHFSNQNNIPNGQERYLLWIPYCFNTPEETKEGLGNSVFVLHIPYMWKGVGLVDDPEDLARCYT